ncbi:MAG TPA: hypothetical protein VL131_03070 [Gammaproteobacteria bacterium]|nr:hypothetical protein [Gammaproteobacteria bacterium]
MRLDTVLYRNGALFLAATFVVVIAGFWPTFYSQPLSLKTTLLEFHGLAMTLWCVMLIEQAYLIRVNQRDLHKKIGKVSYVLAPSIVALGFAVAHHALHGTRDVVPNYASLVLYVLGGISLFGVFYVLAMCYRRAPQTHARFMVATVFPIYPAATDRLIGRLLAFDDTFRPSQLVAWYAGDLLLLALALWDWRSNRRLGVFALVLTIMLVYQASIFTLADSAPWKTFANWFVG